MHKDFLLDYSKSLQHKNKADICMEISLKPRHTFKWGLDTNGYKLYKAEQRLLPRETERTFLIYM